MATATIVPVATKAVETASSIGGTVDKAVTTPIYSRKWKRTKEARDGSEVEVEQEVNLTPAGVLAGALAGFLALASLQRGVRTGTLQAGPLESQYKNQAGRVRWSASGPPLAKVGSNEVWTATGKTRQRPRIRYRDNVADYQPFARGL